MYVCNYEGPDSMIFLFVRCNFEREFSVQTNSMSDHRCLVLAMVEIDPPCTESLIINWLCFLWLNFYSRMQSLLSDHLLFLALRLEA